jgi:HipA-like protein
MLKSLQKILAPSYNRKLKVNKDQTAELQLMFDDLEVGRLKFENEKWNFAYSEDFKNTSGIKPLADFPDLNKTYENSELWPFFASRIPSTSRPRVKKILEREEIADNDLLALLTRFGKHTITNPFELHNVAK